MLFWSQFRHLYSNQTRKPFLESHLEMWKRHYSKLNFNTWKYSHKNSFEYFLLNIGPLDWVGSEKEAGLKEKVHVLVLTSDSRSNNELLDILVSVKVNSMGDNFQLFGAQRAWNLGMGKITGKIMKNILVFGHFLWYLHNFTLISSHFAGILLIFPLLLL